MQDDAVMNNENFYKLIK